MCEMEEIISIAKKKKLHLLKIVLNLKEQNIKINFQEQLANLVVFLYPTKILGAYGDGGGFILTNDYNVYKKIKRLDFTASKQ